MIMVKLGFKPKCTPFHKKGSKICKKVIEESNYKTVKNHDQFMRYLFSEK